MELKCIKTRKLKSIRTKNAPHALPHLVQHILVYHTRNTYNLQNLPINKMHATQKGFIEFLCHFTASCIGVIRNTLKSSWRSINSNTKPQEVEIHSQGHKTLLYGTRMHVGPQA